MEKSEAFIQPSSKIRRLEEKKSEEEKPLCLYGSCCFRRSPAHLKAYRHPKKNSHNQPNLPPCKYGAQCYDRNLLHFAMYYHPTADPRSAQSSGSDNSRVDFNPENGNVQHSVVDELVVNECLIEKQVDKRWVAALLV